MMTQDIYRPAVHEDKVTGRSSWRGGEKGGWRVEPYILGVGSDCVDRCC